VSVFTVVRTTVNALLLHFYFTGAGGGAFGVSGTFTGAFTGDLP
jgi:hypothetical protein